MNMKKRITGYIRKKMGDMNIRKKIIFYVYMILTPILLVICSLIASYRYSETRGEYEERQNSSVSTLAASLDIIQQDVNYLSLNMAINQDTRSILNASDVQSLNADSSLWIHKAPVQMIEEIVALKGYVRTLSLYPENGVIPYLRCMDSSAYISSLDQIRNTEVYRMTVECRGKGVWVRVGKGKGDIYQANSEEKLVLCREVFDLSKKTPLGFLTVGVSEEEVRGWCQNALQSEEEGIILLNHLGQEIGRYGSADETVLSYISEHGLLKYEEYHESFEQKELFLYRIQDEGCYICKIVPQKSFWDFFWEIVYMPVVLMLGIVFGLFPVLLIVSNIISKPLVNVCQAMEKFGEGDFKQRVEIGTNDEVGQVASGFNEMVKLIEQLINKNYIMALKERETELATLQAQINPHFLYNALDSIYWQALDMEDEETAESIYQLSQLFRLVLGKGEKLVTVEMEAELLKRYLEIQKLRFQQQMEFYLDIAPEIMNVKIPKLILQPFVENAVVHGMQKQEGICVIRISGAYAGEKMEFQISDTGAGMTQEQLKQIWEEGADKAYSGQKIGGYAIKNVRERLELGYGKEFHLEIKSQVGKGTVVTIMLPRKTWEEEIWQSSY